MTTDPRDGSIYRRSGKRALDLLIGIPVAVILAPAMAVIAILVKRDLGSPVLFRQPRTGIHGRSFSIIKFRSMTEARGPDGRLLPDDSPEAWDAARAGLRRTPFGDLLRRTSLDELTEIFNVLRGDMSLVGPRPLVVQYLDRYSPRQSRRHEVRPGITGWAQVHGRQALSFEERFELDVWYVDNLSLALDLRILGMTILEVVRQHGTNEPGYATGTEFMGSPSADDTG